MAVLTAEQLGKLRMGVQTEGDAATWLSTDMDAALQAIEDKWEEVRPQFSAAIDVATNPLVFSNVMKKKLGRYWLRQKFDRGG